MKISVVAKPSAREQKVEKISDNEYRISVKEPPLEGRANRAIENAIADHFGIAKSRVRIVSGMARRNKIAEVL